MRGPSSKVFELAPGIWRTRHDGKSGIYTTHSDPFLMACRARRLKKPLRRVSPSTSRFNRRHQIEDRNAQR